MANWFECVLSVVPQIIDFTNSIARAKFMPFLEKSATEEHRRSSSNGVPARFDRVLREAEFWIIFSSALETEALESRTLEVDQKCRLSEWETGAVWRVGTAENTLVREYFKYQAKKGN